MIDISPFLDMGLVILMATVGVVITWLGKKVSDWFGLEFDKKHREVLQGTLVIAINSAMTNIRNRQSGKLFIGDKDRLVYLVVSYLSKSIPDALKRFGIDLESKEGLEKIYSMTEARLAGLAFDNKEDNVVQMKPVAPPEKKE